MHYGNIFEYLSLWSEVQFLKIQKSKNLTNLDFTPETCQKIEKKNVEEVFAFIKSSPSSGKPHF